MLELGSLDFLSNKVVLITGGTGSLGKSITQILLQNTRVRKIIIFSRDELKQFDMKNQFKELDKEVRLRFFLGNVREIDRCMMAFNHVDYIIHAAALKQVPAAEYNPFEFVKTNILGAQNIIMSSIERNVKKVIALSTDKAASPINLYGSTKFCSDKLFVAGNKYSGPSPTGFSAVRYGNVVGSRGSVIPFFLKQRASGVLPITHFDMTRFWITLDQAAYFVLNCLGMMDGEEIFIPKIPSMRIVELARFIGPECELKEVGIRPGEKMHEVMIPEELGRESLEFDNYFIIKPSVGSSRKKPEWMKGKECPEGFSYTSKNNTKWMDKEDMRKAILALGLPEAEYLRV